MRVEIVKIEGEKEERFNVELNGEILCFGRGAQKEDFIPLPRCEVDGEPVLSRIHCTLMQEKGDWWFISGEPGGDGAKNGCWLDGELVQRPVRLKAGQTFILRNPPPFTLELQVSEDLYDLQDTLTPELIDVPQLSQEKVKGVERAIADLHNQIRQNQADDKTARAQAAALSAAVAKAVKQYHGFQVEVSTTQRLLEQRLDQQIKQQKQQSQQLARTLSALALAIAVIGGATFFVEREQRSQYGAVIAEILLLALGGGGLYYANRNQDNGEDS